ncbi:hypothetical protein Goari_015253, partial [Gossypium aridum]|nr:hypothetical protein [Gossypium aridum]
VLEILQPFLHALVLDLFLLCIVQHCLDIGQYGLPLLGLRVELLMISNKVERRVQQLSPPTAPETQTERPLL